MAAQDHHRHELKRTSVTDRQQRKAVVEKRNKMRLIRKHDAWLAYFTGERDRRKLMTIGNVDNVATIRKWEKEFQSQLERRLSSLHTQTMERTMMQALVEPEKKGISVTDRHRVHLQAIDNVINTTMHDLEELPKITDQLLSAIARIDDDEGAKLQNAVLAFCKAADKRDKLVSTLIKAKKAWDEGTGLAAEMERNKIWRTAQTKIAAQHAAKRQIEEIEASEEPRDVNPNNVETPITDPREQHESQDVEGTNMLEVFKLEEQESPDEEDYELE